MMTSLPHESYIHSQVKMAELEAKANEERLYKEVRAPHTLRSWTAWVLYWLAERLAPELGGTDPQGYQLSRQL